MRIYKRPTKAGDQYQDLFGIEIIKDWLIDPDKFEYLVFDASEVDGSSLTGLDDIVAKRSDGKFELQQIKFTVDPSDTRNNLSFDWLLRSRPQGTSLFQKWAEDVKTHYGTGSLQQAMLKTNRRPDDIFAAALDNHQLNITKIPDDIRSMMVKQLENEDSLILFCDNFMFLHSLQMLEDFENTLESTFVPDFTDEYGWLKLRKEIPIWSTITNRPSKDGKVLLTHIKQLLSSVSSETISQNFYTPSGYSPPDDVFHTQIMDRVVEPGVTVVWGTPGIGKSTYVSYVVDRLKESKLHVSRHHFFLSLNDTSVDRIRFETVVKSIKDQISKMFPRVSIPQSIDLRQLLETTADKCFVDGKSFCLVIDGLDHVWRERGEIGQLDQLFNHLFPLPDHLHLLIGTQKVPDNQLPQKLKAHVSVDDWLELPKMSKLSVGSYLQSYVEDSFIREEQVPECSNVIYEKTQGHPLYLHYTVRAIIDNGHHITQNNIMSTPDCPAGDIEQYYRSLWGRLSTHAREMLHLIASSLFSWPDENSLYQCLGDNPEHLEAFESINHILVSQKSGLRVFHESVLVFIRSLEEHESASKRLLPEVKRWLDNEAPEYWKWAYLWLVKAQLSETEDIITGPNRVWLIDAFRRAYPKNQIKYILQKGELAALEEGRLVELVRLDHLFWRLDNVYDFGDVDYPAFLDLALSCSEDTYIIDWMVDNLNLIDTALISAVTKHLGSNKNPRRQYQCFTEMNNRIRFGIEFDNSFIRDNITAVTGILEVVAHSPVLPLKNAIRFISQFSDAVELFEYFLHHLLLQGRGDDILKLWSDANLSNALKEPLAKYTALFFLREKIDISTRTEAQNLRYSLEGKILLRIRNKSFQPTAHSIKIFKDRDFKHPSIHIDFNFFYFHFLESFYTALSAEGKFKYIKRPIPDHSPENALSSAMQILDDLALHAVNILKNNPLRLADLSFVYDFMSEKQQIRTQEIDSMAIENAIKAILPRVAIELMYLAFVNSSGPAEESKINESSVENNYWYNRHFFILNLIEWQLKLYPDEIANNHLDEALVNIQNLVSEQWAITEECLKLIKYTLLYEGKYRAMDLLLHCSSAAVGCVTRRDSAAMEFIFALNYCSEAGCKEIYGWIPRLEPIANNIRDYTDGKDTRYIPQEFIRIVSKHAPENLPLLLEHYQLKEEWWYRDMALKAIIDVADMNEPGVHALMKTLSEDQHLSALKRRADEGDSTALKLLNEQIEFLGKNPIRESGDETSDDQKSDSNEWENAINLKDYPPDKLNDFITYFNNQKVNQNDALINWIDYWACHDKAIEVIHAIETHYTGETHLGGNEHLWRIFELSISVQGKNQAFEWAIRYGAHNSIWSRYYSRDVEDRLERIAKHYKEKWLEFIQRVGTEIKYRYGRKYDVAVGRDLLVYFLIKVDQADLAVNVTEAMLCSLEDDVAHMPLPRMDWISETRL